MKKEDQKTTYTVEIECRNCGHVGCYKVPYGTEWRRVVQCPNCKCDGSCLEKTRTYSKIGTFLTGRVE